MPETQRITENTAKDWMGLLILRMATAGRFNPLSRPEERKNNLPGKIFFGFTGALLGIAFHILTK